MKRIVMYTDGGARGNPGISGVGIRIEDDKGDLIKQGSKYIGEQTNNYAEYEAVRLGLLGVKKLFGEEIAQIHVDSKLDSELVVKQLNGIYKIKTPSIKEQYDRVQKVLLSGFGKVTFTHVRREQNKYADALANEAMDRKA